MRKINYKFLVVFGLMAVMVGMGVISASTKRVSANSDSKNYAQRLAIAVKVAGKGDVITKIPKNMGVVSVSTDQPMSVYLDGVELGKTAGNQVKFEKEVTPGIHEVKIVGVDGKEFNKTYTFVKGVRNCICLKTVVRETTKDCPYDIQVTGPEKVTEGDLVTFAAVGPIAAGTALNYIWKVSPSSARVTSGLGTQSITVDTAGLGGQTLSAEVNVGDGMYDKECSQQKSAITIVESPSPVPTTMPTPYKFDEWDAKTFDDDKFRFDNLAIELQNKPDSQGYVIMYQGTDKISVRSLNVEKLSKRSLNYMVNNKGVNRMQFVNQGARPHTRYEVWIVPPGANPPVPQD